MRKSSMYMWLAAGASTMLVSWALLKSRSSFAAQRRKSPDSILVIGDSQTARHFGEAMALEFSESSVEYFGKPGATHEDYLSDPALISTLQSLSCADVIYIQLGDNGVPNRPESIRSFAENLRAKCPNAKVYWGGPMKAVHPSFKSNYVNVTDPSSRFYLPKLNEMRRVWVERLHSALEDSEITFVDNYALQESRPSSAPFSDSRGGDGIHLQEASAQDLAKLIRGILEG